MCKVMSAMDGQCHVVLNELTVMADIGAFAAEHGVLQPLLLRVELSVVPPARDDLALTYDYAAIRAHAQRLAGQRINLIETFAGELARACLASDLVREALVEIRKPGALRDCLAGTRVRLSKPARG